MRQTGRTSRIVNHIVEQLHNVGQCIATDHVVLEYPDPKLDWLEGMIQKVEDRIGQQTGGSKGVQTRILRIEGLPYVKFTLVSQVK